MSITANPASLDGENRASKQFSLAAENLKEHTGFRSKNQQYRALWTLLAAAPDEELHPIICHHWPVASKQQLMAGLGGEV